MPFVFNPITGNLDLVNSASSGGSTTPGGSSPQLQFNNAGAFGGASAANYDATNGRLGINTTIPSERLTVNGNFNVRDADTPTKQYRFRTNGSNLDFEAGGSDLIMSTWSGPAFTGTQYQQLTMSATGGNMLTERNFAIAGMTFMNGGSTFKRTSTTDEFYTASTSDFIIIAKRNVAANQEVKLPNSYQSNGRLIVVTKGTTTPNTVVFATNGGDISIPNLKLTVPGETVMFTSEGGNDWYVISRFSPGAISGTVRSVTASTTVTSADSTVFCNTAAGAVTVTIPAPSTMTGREIKIKKTTTDSNTLTITPASGNIDGLTSFSTTATSLPSYTIQSDGTNYWFI